MDNTVFTPTLHKYLVQKRFPRSISSHQETIVHFQDFHPMFNTLSSLKMVNRPLMTQSIPFWTQILCNAGVYFAETSEQFLENSFFRGDLSHVCISETEPLKIQISVNYFAGGISAPQNLHWTVSLFLLGSTIWSRLHLGQVRLRFRIVLIMVWKMTLIRFLRLWIEKKVKMVSQINRWWKDYNQILRQYNWISVGIW